MPSLMIRLGIWRAILSGHCLSVEALKFALEGDEMGAS
jgi:hypothetical protein